MLVTLSHSHPCPYYPLFLFMQPQKYHYHLHIFNTLSLPSHRLFPFQTVRPTKNTPIFARGSYPRPNKTPLYLLIGHTQRSPFTNHISQNSANLTQPSKLTSLFTNLPYTFLLSYKNSPQNLTVSLQNNFTNKLKYIPTVTSTLVQHTQLLKIG